MQQSRVIYSKSINQKLKNVLSSKQAKNSSYSIRAFARDLGVSVSALHDYISNKKTPSPNKIIELCHGMKISEVEIEEYITPAKEVDGKKSFVNDVTICDEKLREDMEIIASDLYHLGYLGLFTLTNFSNDKTWILDKLKVTSEKLLEIEKRLYRCGLIDHDKSGNYFKSQNASKMAFSNVSTSVEFSKKLQNNCNDLMLTAIDSCAKDELSHSIILFPVNKNKIDIAKEKISTFRRELAVLMSEDDTLEDLYVLGITFNPITNIVRVPREH